jgi:tRNA wybutosine-synthesizing protein 3
MPRDHFLFRKQNQLKKQDKSFKQSWDKKIIPICEKINKLEKYYTTSSCSGRILLIINSEEKRDDLFLKVWHEKISLKELSNELKKINSKKLIYFKQDPCILHIATPNLETAQKIHDLGKEAGWKRCGIISSKKRFIVELNATEKMEFPIYKNKILVDKHFLKIIVEQANKKIEKSWECIKKLEKSIESLS